MSYRMNHPSVWAKFYDECVGHYRYPHKELGVVRDSIRTTGRVFKMAVKQQDAKAGNATVEKATKAVMKGVVDKIRQLLRRT